jgi:acetyltransferase-like isoleucine patch superfamily enzyme
MQVNLDDKILQRLSDNRIYLTDHGGTRFPPNTEIHFLPNAVAEPYSAILAGGSIPTIGSFSFTSSGVDPAQIIGRYCSISWNLKIMATNHPLDFVSTSQFSYDQYSIQFRQCIADSGGTAFGFSHESRTRANRDDLPLIGHDVWIGQDVILARGITLGHGCVVAAGSVVTKSVPPYAIVGGNPAKLIRMRFPEDLVRRLLASRWWQYKFNDFNGMRHENPEIFLYHLEQMVEAQDIKPFRPPLIRLGEIFDSK